MTPALPPARGTASGTRCFAVVLKGYPRLSETFIAQEIKALEDLGLTLKLVSLRHPTDQTIHPIHREIHASVNYLPEYAYREPIRVLRGLVHAARRLRFGPAARAWLRDLGRDPTVNRVRRFAQALVLARELPPECHALYAHFIHTPASVARYASILVQRPWAVSAHAKDIWTIPAWEKQEKLSSCGFAVTCTQSNTEHLKALADRPDRVHRLYHGVDFRRFPDPGPRIDASDGSATRPATLVSVGRAVPKKGYPVLLKALSRLPRDLAWRFVHVGGGPELPALKQLAIDLDIASRVEWRGALPQEAVLDIYRDADLFVLASIVTPDGDRDGLPNVLMEAQSQRLCCVASNLSGIPELIEDGDTGFLVPPGDDAALCRTIESLVRDPDRRADAAARALGKLRASFSSDREIGHLAALLSSL